MKSPFQEKYPLLHSLMSHHFDDEREPNMVKREALQQRRAEVLKAGEKIVPLASRYLGSVLHDSRIISATLSGDTLTIAINDDSARTFCQAVAEFKGRHVSRRRIVCPLILTYRNIKRLSFCHVNHKRRLLPLGRAKYLPKLSEYHYDNVFDISPGRVAMAILLILGLYKGYAILDVEAGELTIEERQREAFLEMFGGDFESLFDAYWEHRNAGASFVTGSLRGTRGDIRCPGQRRYLVFDEDGTHEITDLPQFRELWEGG